MIAPRRVPPQTERIDVPDIVPATEDTTGNAAQPKYVRAQPPEGQGAVTAGSPRALTTDPDPEGIVPVVPSLVNTAASALRVLLHDPGAPGYAGGALHRYMECF
jgi:hypothetical protein